MRNAKPAWVTACHLLCKFVRRSDGTTQMEYVFLVALIGLAVITAYTGFAAEMNDLWDFINTSFVGA